VCAMGPDSRRRDDYDVPPSPRSGNIKGEACHHNPSAEGTGGFGGISQAVESYIAVRYFVPSTLESPRHQLVSDGLASTRAFGHSSLLSASCVARWEQTPQNAAQLRPQ